VGELVAHCHRLPWVASINPRSQGITEPSWWHIEMLTRRSRLPQRPRRRLRAALPQDRPERVVWLPRRVVPLRLGHHWRPLPRALPLHALHRHHVRYAPRRCGPLPPCPLPRPHC
jgi:hypothetical protein